MRFLIFTILYGLVRFSKGTIHFYEDINYQGEFFQIQFVPYGVHDIGELEFGPTKSIRTSECVVLIEGTEPDDINLVVEPSGINDIALSYADPDNPVMLDELNKFAPTKFSLCEDYFGSKYTSRGVIITFNSESGGGAQTNITLEEVKGCVTFPSSLGSVSRVYNFGNCVHLYASDDCDIDSKITLRGGTSMDSLNPGEHFQSKSLSHCVECPNCMRFNATLQNITLTQDYELIQALTPVYDLGLKTRIVNSAPAEVVQEYTASVDIQHIIQIPINPDLAEMNSVKISPTVQIFAPKNLTFLTGFLKATIAKAYKNRQFIKPHTVPVPAFTNEMTKTVTTTKLIALKQCKTQNVQSGGRVMQNVPVNFEMFFHITIAEEGTSHNADFIERSLEGGGDTLGNLIVVETIDDRTVLAKVAETMVVTYGKETLIEANGRVLYYCPQLDDIKEIP